jgi:hypothetical protein
MLIFPILVKRNLKNLSNFSVRKIVDLISLNICYIISYLSYIFLSVFFNGRQNHIDLSNNLENSYNDK